MRRLIAAFLSALVAPAIFAQAIASTSAGIVVANDGRVHLEGKWSVDGVEHPTVIAASDTRIAVLDALNDRATIVELASGTSRTISTAGTPVAALFIEEGLFVLARDGGVLQTPQGDVPLAADPAFLGRVEDRLYVYSRSAGVLQEIQGTTVLRRLEVPPFASDMEISGTTAFLVYPRDARIRTIDLERMAIEGELAVGAVPTDLAFAGGGSLLTARLLAVADPSARRVWLTESTQSLPKAVGRGFLRGLLGLGLFGSRASEFPTGVDRVEIRGNGWIAYDSSSGSLYRFGRRNSALLATGVPPAGFALTLNGVAWWDGTSVAQTTFE